MAPTNEAGLSGGQDQGDGGRTTASDTPGGGRNMGAGGEGNPTADQNAGGRGGLSTPEMLQGEQDRTDGGHRGPAGDPVEGAPRDSATGRGPEGGSSR